MGSDGTGEGKGGVGEGEGEKGGEWEGREKSPLKGFCLVSSQDIFFYNCILRS